MNNGWETGLAWTAIIAESDAPSSGNAVINYNDEGVTITYTVNTAVEVDSLFLTLTDEYNNAVRLKIQIELSNIVKNDVDGDGKSDLLWRSYAKGWNFLWTMDGAFMSSATPINVVASNEWDMVGQGDYDADGKSDIFCDINGAHTICMTKFLFPGTESPHCLHV